MGANSTVAGPAGSNGVSVSNALVNDTGHIVFTLTDNSVIDAGLVSGNYGESGFYYFQANTVGNAVATFNTAVFPVGETVYAKFSITAQSDYKSNDSAVYRTVAWI